ncbi:pyridoxamine 5'-phosphate oxidase family protein [Nocardia uniformis]|uniref:Pyridoxamine 5'-phosphate oxidase family protein n=1 Tax=Nocardia uniformis TaxID=53432 RepID=A0A849CE72_9NOCA|nr:pyridoxamine 5'-phosphate oxidase family protein [Nocardia uniformis]NNH73569.1 pyridoxamine 5'-phosphate oxidase family protein [Nocardia uniformis]
MRLLASVQFGRIAFSRYALPVIRPVDHIVAGDEIIVYVGAAISISSYQQVVAYEVDTIDHRTRLGWCVIVTGDAEFVSDPAEIDRYHALLTGHPPEHGDRIIRIHPDIVTGVEYVDAASGR